MTSFKLFVAALFVAPPSLLTAASIILTDVNPTYSASATNCFGFSGPWAGCGAHGYLDYGTNISTTTAFNFSGFNNPGAVGGATFADSFNAWNAANAAGWTLNPSAAIFGLSYTVDLFRTFATDGAAGVSIDIALATNQGYAGPALSTLFWSQALAVNYLVTEPAGVNHSPAILSMDTFSFNLGGSALPENNTCSTTANLYCDPVFPLRYEDGHFFDQPTGIYPIDSFRGIALLSNVDFTNKILTVYDTGVNFGFDVWVAPEPGTFALIPTALGLMLVARRRRKS